MIMRMVSSLHDNIVRRVSSAHHELSFCECAESNSNLRMIGISAAYKRGFEQSDGPEGTRSLAESGGETKAT